MKDQEQSGKMRILKGSVQSKETVEAMDERIEAVLIIQFVFSSSETTMSFALVETNMNFSIIFEREVKSKPTLDIIKSIYNGS